MMKINILCFALLASIPTFAQADVSILGFGLSKHLGCMKKTGCDFNEVNPGLGIEYRPSAQPSPSTAIFFRGGVYKDSLKNNAVFGTVGIRKDFDIKLGEDIKPGIGIQAGYRTGKHEGGFVLPFVYLQKSKLAVELGYAPLPKSFQEKHKFKGLVTLNLRYDL